MLILEKENLFKIVYYWYIVGYNMIEVGDMIEIFMLIEIGFLFDVFIYKLELFLFKNEMLFIFKEICMSFMVFIKLLLEVNDCNFFVFEIYKYFNMLMNYNIVI